MARRRGWPFAADSYPSCLEADARRVRRPLTAGPRESRPPRRARAWATAVDGTSRPILPGTDERERVRPASGRGASRTRTTAPTRASSPSPFRLRLPLRKACCRGRPPHRNWRKWSAPVNVSATASVTEQAHTESSNRPHRLSLPRQHTASDGRRRTSLLGLPHLTPRTQESPSRFPRPFQGSGATGLSDTLIRPAVMPSVSEASVSSRPSPSARRD